MTYTELTNLIKNFCDSTETTFVNTIADFVKNAEERIFELVQFDFFRKSVSGNLTAGNRFLTAPSDYIASFSLAVIDSSGDYHYLLKKHPSFMQEYSEDPTDTNLRGLPLYYAEYDKELSTGSDNGSTLTVSPVPDSAYNVELNYLHKPQSLTSATTGTWLSTNAKNQLYANKQKLLRKQLYYLNSKNCFLLRFAQLDIQLVLDNDHLIHMYI